jgi:D-alanyl-D-alanine carboxypeptidase
MNTNLNLDGKNCFGIKTGNTPNAGPCLASYFQSNSS